MTETRAEIRLPTQDVRDDLPFYTRQLGFRLDMIYPADNPSVAVLSGHGLRLRIEKGAPESPGTLRLLTDDPQTLAGPRVLTAPNGTRVEIDQLNPPLVLPQTDHAFVVRRLADQAPWIVGRAGMHYRDLVPSRLGGAMKLAKSSRGYRGIVGAARPKIDKGVEPGDPCVDAVVAGFEKLQDMT